MTQFAFVFPGQGSQTVGMLSDLAAQYPIIEETFREASDALGYDLWALTQQGPAEELNKIFKNSCKISDLMLSLLSGLSLNQNCS